MKIAHPAIQTEIKELSTKLIFLNIESFNHCPSVRGLVIIGYYSVIGVSKRSNNFTQYINPSLDLDISIVLPL